jgi:predicted nucleotidyltransferase component of viral defense system
MLRTETIERATLELLKALMLDTKLHHFTLVGGTALSLYMGHRKSIDLDLFSRQTFDVNELEKHLIDTYNFKSKNPTKKSDVTLIGLINDIKVDCIQYDYRYVKPVCIYEDIRLCSMHDIAAMKLTAISQNGTRLKDFVDIAFLSAKMPFREMLETFEVKYPNTNKISAIKGLAYFDDIDFSTKIELIKGVFSWKEIEKRLKEMIKYPHKVFPQFPTGIESERKSGVRFKR